MDTFTYKLGDIRSKPCVQGTIERNVDKEGETFT